MITISVWHWLSLVCFACGLTWCVLSSWEWLQRWAERRVERRMKPDPRVRKFLRHAKSGRVGLCLSSGFGKHRWLGWLRAEERVELVMCPACAKGILEPMPHCLLSYADPSAGHAGTIYKAANWKTDGRTDDERKTARCDYYDARTGKKYGRRGNMPPDAVIERRPRVSKHRFFLPLGAGVGVKDSCGTTRKGHNDSRSETAL